MMNTVLTSNGMGRHNEQSHSVLMAIEFNSDDETAFEQPLHS